MRTKLLPLILGLLLGVVTGTVPMRATAPAATEVVVLPPMVVEGKFSELVCGVRFRYGVPGNRMRSLVVRRMPASWATAGVNAGDTIVAIDGRKIDGQGLAELGEYLSSKPKDKPVSYSFEIRSKTTKAVQRLEMTAERESGEITIAYP